MRRKLLLLTFVAFAAAALPAYALSYDGMYAIEAAAAYSGASPEPGVSLDVNFYYNYLADYGSWIRMGPHGYVWCPRHVGYGWRPYGYGHWVWSDYGWTWISDEDWGWIPFHYGRWGWDDGIGWFWVPGTTWGPAWVSWRYNDEYCGWAPLPPGIEFEAQIGFRSLSINIPNRFWIFVQAKHFLDPNVRSRMLPYERNVRIINNTTVYNNIYVRNDRIVNEGIALDDVRRLTKKDVPRYSLRDAGRPGRARISGHEVELYRPAFQGNPSAPPTAVVDTDNARSQPAPARVFEQQHPPKSPQPTAEIKKRQKDEKNLAQETQSQEMKDMRQRQSEEMKRAKNSAEKERVKRDYQSEISKLQKSHEAEKKQMAERHRRDNERPGGAPPTKQGEPREQDGKEKQEQRTNSATHPDHR
jgi:hypothetical protein